MDRKKTLGPEGPQGLFSADVFTSACDKLFWRGGRPRKTLRTTSRRRFLKIATRDFAAENSAIFEVKILILCMNTPLAYGCMKKYLSAHEKFFGPLIYPILAYFGPFSGSRRLIITHQTSQRSYIMPLGSDTSVGTFPGIHRTGS